MKFYILGGKFEAANCTIFHEATLHHKESLNAAQPETKIVINKKRKECHLSSQDTPESTPKYIFFPCLAIALTISDVHNDPRTWTSVIMTNGYKNINGNIHMLRSEKVSLQYQAVMKHSIHHITCETAPPTLLGLLMHTTLPARTTTSNQRLLASSQNPVKSNQTGNPKKSDSEASRD